ncbi:antibiotic biosynthesis monooxygenase [Streptomyces collinus]|uniref:putative quinol monooxygenase n=1 Tax=Streptomyces collinus TaxID=42684 RepID=UPI0033E61EBA
MTQSPSDLPLPHVDAVGRGTALITRVSEARVRPERFEAFRDFIVSAVRTFPDRPPGLVAHEVLLAPPGTLLYVSRWRSEADLADYAGEHWRDRPVVLPGEDEYLVAPLQVRHFTLTPLN